jgi:hypothetical protein
VSGVAEVVVMGLVFTHIPPGKPKSSSFFQKTWSA